MSKYHIQEGLGDKTGRKYYQIFVNGTAVGNPCSSREEAESLVRKWEEEDEDKAQRQRRKPSEPSLGM